MKNLERGILEGQPFGPLTSIVILQITPQLTASGRLGRVSKAKKTFFGMSLEALEVTISFNSTTLENLHLTNDSDASQHHHYYTHH